MTDIKEVFDSKGCTRISTADLIDELIVDDMKPWATYHKGKPMTPRQLARRLNEYGIKPQTIRMAGRTPKGFMRDSFTDTFERYIPSGEAYDLSATPQQNPANPYPEPAIAVADNLACCT